MYFVYLFCSFITVICFFNLQFIYSTWSRLKDILRFTYLFIYMFILSFYLFIFFISFCILPFIFFYLSPYFIFLFLSFYYYFHRLFLLSFLHLIISSPLLSSSTLPLFLSSPFPLSLSFSLRTPGPVSLPPSYLPSAWACLALFTSITLHALFYLMCHWIIVFKAKILFSPAKKVIEGLSILGKLILKIESRILVRSKNWKIKMQILQWCYHCWIYLYFHHNFAIVITVTITVIIDGIVFITIIILSNFPLLLTN